MALWGRIFGHVTGGSTEYDRAIALYDRGQYAEAIAAFENTAARFPAGSLVGRLSRFYLVESLSALATVQLTADDDSESAEPKADYPAAIANLQRAIALSPDYADLHGRLARSFLYLDNFAEALEAANQALEINPNYAHALLLRASALYFLGYRAEGLQSAERATALETATPLLQNRIAAVRQADSAGEPTHVLKKLREIIDDEAAVIDRDARQARSAQVGFQTGELESSIASYRKAVEANPTYADLRNKLGVALHAAGRYAEASVEFERAVGINPRYVEAYVNRGLSLEKLGQATAAYDTYRTALKLEADHPVAGARVTALKEAGTAVRTVET